MQLLVSKRIKKGILVATGMSFVLFVFAWVVSRFPSSITLLPQTAPRTASSEVFVSEVVGSQVVSPIETHRFVDARVAKGLWPNVQGEATESCARLRGAVVNHHILASDLIGRLFARLALCRPNIKRVIILSPDHFLRGTRTISTHLRSYLVAGEEVRSDKLCVQEAISTLPFVHEEPELFEREHGMGALIPFLHEAWPKAMVCSFALRSDLSKKDAEQFVVWLKGHFGPEALLIVSSDMSHYLSRSEAFNHDERTRDAFRRSDMEFFWKAQDAYTDNGKALWIALRALGPVRWQEGDHRISTDYDGSSNDTTSYITGWWSAPSK